MESDISKLNERAKGMILLAVALVVGLINLYLSTRFTAVSGWMWAIVPAVIAGDAALKLWRGRNS